MRACASFEKLNYSVAVSLNDYVLLDFETTGLSNRDEIVEVGCAKVSNGRITKTFQTLVDPEMPIPYFATKIHGIHNADVADSPTVREVLTPLLKFVGDDILVAYNADFDMRFLKKAMVKYGCTQSIKYLDALDCVKAALPGQRTYKLQDIRERLGIESNNAHRSLDDVIITHKVFEMCRGKIVR